MTELDRTHPVTQSQQRHITLFCVPSAGGTALMYRHWKTLLHPSIRLRPLELAGRGRRFDDSYYNDLDEAVEDLYRLVEPHLEGDDLAFFGHSMGALLCYELIGKIWKHQSLAPVHAFMSGRVPPNNDDIKKLYHTSDAQLLKEVIQWGVFSKQQLKDKALVRMFLSILRADVKIVDTYNPQDREQPPLPCSISVLTGSKDVVAQSWKMSPWTDFTTQLCSFHVFPGGHLYIEEYQKQVVDLINTTLSAKYSEL
jgi:medium-chain acyl-[acyl-carrier-protein] hydrolase